MPQPQKVCICGIGYVGLTLAAVMAEKGFSVYGSEINEDVVECLNRGEPHFHERGLSELLHKYLGSRLRFGTKIPEEAFDAYIISVGTPLKASTKEPNLDYLKNVAHELADHLCENSLVILRSTVPIGITRNVIHPILSRSHHVKIAFCPERTVEGRALQELKSLPQIVGGLDVESTEQAAGIFRQVTPHIVTVSSLETAEMVKLLDNSFRDINFAYANQVAAICELFDIDAMEAISCANLGYLRNHIPVPGFVGGACLEKDPHILVDSAKQRHYDAGLIRYGRQIHESLPSAVIERVCQILREYGKEPKDTKVFLTGLAFKGQPETDDLRGSPSLEIIKSLRDNGISSIFVHDFIVPSKAISNFGVISSTLEEGFADADAVIIGNNHPNYQKIPIVELLGKTNHPVVFFDSWRVFDKEEMGLPGIHYEGLGLKRPARW